MCDLAGHVRGGAGKCRTLRVLGYDILDDEVCAAPGVCWGASTAGRFCLLLCTEREFEGPKKRILCSAEDVGRRYVRQCFLELLMIVFPVEAPANPFPCCVLRGGKMGRGISGTYR